MTGKIGIVARKEYRGTGVERFQKNTVEYLTKELPNAQKISYDFTGILPFSTTFGKIKLGWQLKQLEDRYDKIFIPSQDMVLFPVDRIDAEIIVYVHDIFPVSTNFSGWFASILGKYYTHQLEKLDKVVVPSMHTKKDLENRTAYNGEIEVVPQGVDNLYEEYTDLEVERDIDLLYVGGSHGRKNFEFVQEVFRKAEHRGFNCVAVTNGDLNHGEVRNNVTDYELAYLYRSSRYYLHPSKQEGFGRPPLEAQRYGAVPLAFPNEINKEIMGDSYEEIRNLLDVLENLRINIREKTVQKQRNNAEKYTWDSTREKLRQIIP